MPQVELPALNLTDQIQYPPAVLLESAMRVPTDGHCKDSQTKQESFGYDRMTGAFAQFCGKVSSKIGWLEERHSVQIGPSVLALRWSGLCSDYPALIGVAGRQLLGDRTLR
jgi:hypothetical protein